mmetsp:Transcript_28595/g.52000  ORF Transcript_28595/g.52000 Transcript_28595/m.52000 type:complete len:232 (+) Transcript_28595:54-749(+)
MRSRSHGSAEQLGLLGVLAVCAAAFLDWRSCFTFAPTLVPRTVLVKQSWPLAGNRGVHVRRRHGPGGVLEEIAERIVPQPGPQFFGKNEAAPVTATTLPGYLLLAVARERFGLTRAVHLAQEEYGARAEDGLQAEQVVRRAVWNSLGSLRDLLLSLEDASDMAYRTQVVAVSNGLNMEQPPCQALDQLEQSIHAGWSAIGDPELLWAAQLLLVECKRWAEKEVVTEAPEAR